MAPDEQALRAMILSHPDDDAPRLIYADWLEEQGHTDRATFIRQQCELATIDEESDPRRWALEQKTATLLKKLRPAWLKPYGIDRERVTFRRGFIDRIADSGELRPARLKALLLDEPICEVELLAMGKHAHILMESPRAEWLQNLDLSSNALDENETNELLSFAGWKRLRRLNLGWCELPKTPLAKLLPTTLTTVEDIELCGVEGFTRKCRRETFQALTNFKRVSLGYTDCSAVGLADLFRVKFPCLEYLDLGAESFNGTDLVEVMPTSKMPELRTLRVFGNPLKNDFAEALAGANPWPQLVELDVGNCGFTTAAAKAFACSTQFPNLRRLHLGNELSNYVNRIGDGGLKALARAKHFPALRELDVLYNRITAKGVHWLCGGSLLGQLWKLDLNNNHIGDAGAIALANCPQIQQLRMVGLYDCAITDVGAKALLDSPHWGKKVRINLESNTISDDLMKKLRRRFPPVPTNRFACSFAAP